MTMNMWSIYLLSFGICMVLMFNISSEKVNYDTSFKYFKYISVTLIAMVILECSGWLIDGVDGVLARGLNYLTNSLLQGLSALPLTAWLLYFDNYSEITDKGRHRRYKIYLLLNAIMIVPVIINLFRPILFVIDDNNVFVRSNSLMYFGSIQVLFLLCYSIGVVVNRKGIPRRIMYIFVMLLILPITATGIQSMNYGSVFIWPSMAFVLFAAYVLVEKEELKKDLVTGLYSRGQFQVRLQNLVKRNKPFTLIMFDLDRFKSINDRFGHREGDRALYEFSRMLSSSTTVHDFAYRFAGDEFVLCVNTVDEEIVERIMKMLDRDVADYNETNSMDYELSFSHGIKSYNENNVLSPDQIVHEVDTLMYENKRHKK